MLVITRKVGESIVIGKHPSASMILRVDQMLNDRVWIGIVGDASVSAMSMRHEGVTMSRIPDRVELKAEHEFTVGAPPFVRVRVATLKDDRVRLAFATDSDVEVHRREVWDAMNNP